MVMQEETWSEMRFTDENVGEIERVISGVGGTALAAWGLSRRDVAGIAATAAGGYLIYRGAMAYCPIRARVEHSAFREPVEVEHAVSIMRSPQELYSFWRKLENLPSFMRHLKSVQETGARTSHWVAKGPANTSFEWDAEIMEEEAGQFLSWRAVEGSEIQNSGWVRFSPLPEGRGTEVRVYLWYAPPAGRVGKTVARFFGEEPELQIREDLRRFKNLMETGEIPTVQGQPHGKRSMLGRVIQFVSGETESPRRRRA
jgi:uncharacterized membrane protein